MRVLVFQPSLVGHYLEYLHHLFLLANKDGSNEYVFIVPEEFKHKQTFFEWNYTQNIVIDYLSPDEFVYCSASGKQLRDSYRICKMTKKYADKHSCINVFCTNIVMYCPMAALILGRKYSLVGIIYKIYLYEDKSSSISNRLLNRLKYLVYSKFGVYKKLLILNDKKSAESLNRIYHSNKFQAIPDPFIPLDSKNVVDIRKKFNIADDKKIFVHFGGLSRRKGTHVILDSIDYLTQDESKNYVFIIAGVAGDSIKDYIAYKIEALSEKVTIIFENRFCEYEYLAGLCQCCNAILIPYQQTDLSSGLLGYASQFQKPVIGPNSGLIGELINQYNLGLSIDASSPVQLSLAYRMVLEGKVSELGKEYCHANNVDKFIYNITESLHHVVH